MCIILLLLYFFSFSYRFFWRPLTLDDTLFNRDGVRCIHFGFGPAKLLHSDAKLRMILRLSESAFVGRERRIVSGILSFHNQRLAIHVFIWRCYFILILKKVLIAGPLVVNKWDEGLLVWTVCEAGKSVYWSTVPLVWQSLNTEGIPHHVVSDLKARLTRVDPRLLIHSGRADELLYVSWSYQSSCFGWDGNFDVVLIFD